MPRYVALLRGVSPMNAKMPELKRCFEEAGFGNVRTVLSSGNVVFDCRRTKPETLERRAVKAMEASLGRSFGTIVRPVDSLQSMLDADPFAGFTLSPKDKCVVTFLRRPPETAPELPVVRGDARILAIRGCEVFTAYVPTGKDAAFMQLIERTFGRDITTRTLGTVRKCVLA